VEPQAPGDVVTQPAAAVPPGWYPDGAGVVRWWDGYRWTEGMARGTTGPFPQPAVPPSVPAGTPVHTVWIWLVVALPALAAIPSIGYMIQLQTGMADFMRWMIEVSESGRTNDPSIAAEIVSREMSLIFTPWYIALLLSGFVIYGLCVWFSFLDRRELLARGFVRPFPWAWSFLSSLVYVIGRSVVVHRRSGRGYAPMWFAIGVQVAMFVVSMIASFALVGSIMQQVVQSVPGTIS
jgi:hypothetical protein